MIPTAANASTSAPPVPAAPPLDEVIRDVTDGHRRADAACGTLPSATTAEQLLDAEQRAANALYAVLEVWHRYCQRFELIGSPIAGGRAPYRLFVRYNRCLQEFEWRRDLVRQLLLGEMAGRA